MVRQPEVRGFFSFLFPSFRLYSLFDLLLLCDGVISEFVLSVKDELSNWATNVFEAWRWDGDNEVRSGIARPPRRQGSARSSRSTSEMADLPVRAGMNLFLMMSSTGA